MKIIDNFLDEDEFKILQQYLTNDSFTWNLLPSIANNKQGLDQYQFRPYLL
jgi:hypothetical protein